jgi:2-polyprenyl-6-methoxyphenol hydroxylase-like FAD-dependent oxidoreductase
LPALQRDDDVFRIKDGRSFMIDDVLVVGAGPTGLSLAITLRRFGVPVRIIDRLAEPATVSKALVVWSATLEALQGAGAVEEFLKAGRRLHAVRIGDGKRTLAEVAVGDGIDSVYPFPVLLPQSKTEQILRTRLAELGVEVERGVELTGLSDDGQAVDVTLARADGTTEESRVRYLAGCDGARSAVRSALGIEFEGLTEPETFLLGDVKIEGGDLDDRCLYIWWHAGGTVALFPFEAGVWRVFGMRDGGDPSQDTTLQELQRCVDRHGPPGLRLNDPGWLAVFHINERLAAHFRKGRCLLAGDAAHIHSPAGGQGMNTGIQDGINLGWKLAYVLRGWGDADLLLDSYEAERRPTAHAIVEEATQRQHMGFSTGKLGRLVKDAALMIVDKLPSIQRMLQVQLSETAIVYRDGPLVQLGEPPRRPGRTDVGSRALEAQWHDVATGREESLWPLISQPRHSLLVFEDEPATVDIGKIATGLADQLHVLRLDGVADPEHHVRNRYQMRAPGWVLIRPDQVVAARGEGTNLGRLSAYFDRALRPGGAKATIPRSDSGPGKTQ